jgi:hypothetical protein
MTSTHRLLAVLTMMAGIALAIVYAANNNPSISWAFFVSGSLIAMLFAHRRPNIDFD